MSPKQLSLPPVAPTVPPKAPSLPPHPPPPRNPAYLRSEGSHKSKSKSEHSRHVKFDDKHIHPAPSQATTLVAPPAAPTTLIVPHGTSGEMVHEHGPVVELKTNPEGGPGYIRVQGGFQVQRYHKYDALIPTNDLFQANSEQQTGVVNAMIAAQLANLSTSNTLNHHRHHDIRRGVETGNTKPLTAANLKKITGHDARAPSDTLTSISRRPPNSKHVATEYKSSEVPEISPHHHPSPAKPASKTSKAGKVDDTKSKPLTCFNCESQEHVKAIGGSFCVCWKCLRMLYPKQAVHAWKTGQWPT